MKSTVIKFILICFPLVLGISDARATDPKQIPEQVEQVNRAVDPKTKPCENCGKYNSYAGMNIEYEQGPVCFLSICDAPAERQSWTDFMDKKNEVAKKTQLPPEITAKLNQLFDSFVAESKQDIEAGMSLLNTAADTRYSEQDKRRFGGAALASAFIRVADELEVHSLHPDGRIEFKLVNNDPKYWQNKFKDPQIAKWLAANIGTVLKDDSMGHLFGIMTVPFSEYLALRYPKLDTETARLQLTKELLGQFTQVLNSNEAKDFAPFVQETLQSTGYKKLKNYAAGQPISATEAKTIHEDIMDVLGDMALLNFLPKAGSAYPKLDLKGELQKSEILDEKRQELLALNDSKYMSNVRQKFMAQCAAGYLSTTVSAPTAAQVVQFKKVEISARQKFQNKILAKYSEHSRNILQKKFQSIRVVLPDDQSVERYRVAKTLSSSVEGGKFRLELNAKSENYKRANTFVMAGDLSMGKKRNIEEEGYEFEEDLATECDDLSVDLSSDSTFPKYGFIMPSQMSLAGNPKAAEGVLGHEMGHVLYSQFNSSLEISEESSAQHKKNLKCIGATHPQSTTRFLEEDFADWVGVNMMAGETLNPFCQLMDISASPAAALTLPENSDDDHSAVFYRILRTEALSGRPLSDDCQKLMRSQLGKNFQFDRCEQ